MLLYLVHTLNIVDAVDYDNAEYEKQSTGQIIGLKKYAFFKNKVLNNNYFKIWFQGHIYTTEILVSDEFKETVEKNNITGVRFEEIWDSND